MIETSVGDCRFCRILEKRKKLSIDEAVDMSDVLDGFQRNARDHARVPMQVSARIASNSSALLYFRMPWQWNSSAHAGFTSGEPWMRVNEDYLTWNVAAQLKDNDSIHSFWKHALNLRKAHEVLVRRYLCLLPLFTGRCDVDRYMAISATYQTTMNKCSRTLVPLRVPRPWLS